MALQNQLTKAAFNGSRQFRRNRTASHFHSHPAPQMAPATASPVNGASRFHVIDVYDDGARRLLDEEFGRELLDACPDTRPVIDDEDLDAQIEADAEEARMRDQWANAIADAYAGGV